MSLNSDPKQEPEEEQISLLLKDFRPEPSQRFYQKMDSMPWMNAAASPTPRRSNLLAGWFASPWRTAAALGLILVFSTMGMLAIPSVQAAAREVFNFFMPAPGDIRDVQVTVPTRGPLESEAKQYFSLTWDQAQKKVAFLLHKIQLLPAGMAFQGAHYDPFREAIILNYANGIQSIWLTEWQAGNIVEYSSIGASATVEPMRLRGVQGEYVRGGWQVSPASQVPLTTSTPGAHLTIGVYWDTEYPQYTLRWQESGIVYEMIYIGDPSLEKKEILQIAESIK